MANSMQFNDSYREQVQTLGVTKVLLRLINPDDKQNMLEAFEHLSSSSRYMRFFGAK